MSGKVLTRAQRTGLCAILALGIVVGVVTASSTAADQAVPQNQSPPAVRGNTSEGSTLTADRGLWKSRSTVAYSYQWLRCLADGTGCVDVPRATDQIYTARSTDVAHSLRVIVTARNKDGAASGVSAPTAVFAPLPAQAPHNMVLPVITGATAPGQILTAGPGTWTGATPIAVSYRWRRCDAGGGACIETSVRMQTYKLSTGDANHAFRVLVTATNAAGPSASLSDSSSVVTRPSKPANTSPPTISGTAQEAKTLTGSRGTWSNSPSGYGYSWQRCNKKGNHCGGIGSARGTTYTLTRSDIGRTIRLSVAATNAGGTATALSAPTAVVTAAAKPVPERPQNTTLPTISGSSQQGLTLKADSGDWTNNPTRYEYSWTRCDASGAHCNGIGGANGTTYSLASTDVGHRLRFKVTAKNSGGSTTVLSAPTAVVAGPAPKASQPANTSPPMIAGTAQDGKALTGNAGTWSNSPTGYDYTWRRCNKKGDDCDGISGVHSTTYTLKEADVGRTIRLRVNAKNSAGSTTATSAPTGVVRAAARPENTSPSTVSGIPQEGKTLTGNRGNWTHSPTDFDSAWLRCDRNGGSCAAIGGAHSTSYTLTSTDVGNTVRFRVTASNSEGSTTATSVPSAAIQKAGTPPPPPLTGCPPRPSVNQVANVATMTAPARLLVDTLQSAPRVVASGTSTLVVRFHITSTCGGPVQGALVYATATPYNQFAIPPEATTGADGWATLVFRRLRGFPVGRRQQLIAIFVRARKPGDNVLGGISTRRLVSVPVRLG